jgi:replication fork clamp-binding protein CrfC
LSTDTISLSNINIPQRAKIHKDMRKKENFFLAPTQVLAASHEKTGFTRLFSLSINWLKWAKSEILTAGLVVF